MRTGTKLIVGCFLIMLAVLLTVDFCLDTSENIQEKLGQLKDDIVPGAIAMMEMSEEATNAARLVTDYAVEGKADDKENAQLSFGHLERSGLVHLEHQKHINSKEQKEARELMAKIQRFTSAGTEIINLKDQGLKANRLLKRKDESAQPALEALLEQIGEHTAVHMKELAVTQEAVYKAHTSGIRVALLASTFIAFLAIAIAFTTKRSIVKPLHALQEGFEKIAQGNLDYKVGTDSTDEIGQLSRTLDKMTEDLKKTTVSIDKISEAVHKQLQPGEQKPKSR